MTTGNPGTAKRRTFPMDHIVLFLLVTGLITYVMKPESMGGKLLDFCMNMQSQGGSR